MGDRMTKTELHIKGEFDQLDELLDALRLEREIAAGCAGIHLCRSCNCLLKPTQKCGAYCPRCAREAAALHAQGAQQDKRVAYAFVAGFVVAVPVLLVVLKLCGLLS